MKLIIAGSRTFDFSLFNIDYFFNQIISLHKIPKPKEIVCGCGGTKKEKVSELLEKGQFASDRGVDLAGEIYGIQAKFPSGPKLIPADWTKNGKAAGPMRNREMAQYADQLLLIWDGNSRGSKNMKEEMEKLGKPVYEVILKAPPVKKEEW